MPNYKEPNVYTVTKRITPQIPETPVDMYPLIIGTGSKTIDKTGVTAVSKGASAAIVIEDKISTVSMIYTVDDWGQSTVISSDNYTVSSTEGTTAITWKTIEGFTPPANGTTIYLDYIAETPEDRFELKRFTDPDDVKDFYGSDIVAGGSEESANRVCIGARLALESGSDVVYALQIKAEQNSATTTLIDKYFEALSEYIIDKPGNPIWRICPVDPGVSKAVRKFVLDMSEPEERAEKFAMLNNEAAEDVTTFEDLYASYVTYCKNNKTFRGQTLYPNKADYVGFDGTTIEVGGELIGCAYAGLEQALDRKSQSATNSSITSGLLNLKGVKMRRSQKNQLAVLGITLLTQESEYGDITVRDALSLDITTDQVEDPCITMAADYTAKYLRQRLGVYIGKYNIDPETISKVKAETDSALQTLVQSTIIKSGTLVSIEQDPDNLKSLVMVIRVGVLYPLKQINITIILD